MENDFYTRSAAALHVRRETFEKWVYWLSHGGSIDPWIDHFVREALATEYQVKVGS